MSRQEQSVPRFVLCCSWTYNRRKGHSWRCFKEDACHNYSAHSRLQQFFQSLPEAGVVVLLPDERDGDGLIQVEHQPRRGADEEDDDDAEEDKLLVGALVVGVQLLQVVVGHQGAVAAVQGPGTKKKNIVQWWNTGGLTSQCIKYEGDDLVTRPGFSLAALCRKDMKTNYAFKLTYLH